MVNEIWIIIELLLMTIAIGVTVKVLNDPATLPWLQIFISALITMVVWWYAPLIPIIFAFLALILCWHLFFLRGREGWDRCIIAALIAFLIFIILAIIIEGVFEDVSESVDSAWESATETD